MVEGEELPDYSDDVGGRDGFGSDGPHVQGLRPCVEDGVEDFGVAAKFALRGGRVAADDEELAVEDRAGAFVARGRHGG